MKKIKPWWAAFVFKNGLAKLLRGTYTYLQPLNVDNSSHLNIQKNAKGFMMTLLIMFGLCMCKAPGKRHLSVINRQTIVMATKCFSLLWCAQVGWIVKSSLTSQQAKPNPSKTPFIQRDNQDKFQKCERFNIINFQEYTVILCLKTPSASVRNYNNLPVK